MVLKVVLLLKIENGPIRKKIPLDNPARLYGFAG
jgi:hypothetical protein